MRALLPVPDGLDVCDLNSSQQAENTAHRPERSPRDLIHVEDVLELASPPCEPSWRRSQKLRNRRPHHEERPRREHHTIPALCARKSDEAAPRRLMCDDESSPPQTEGGRAKIIVQSPAELTLFAFESLNQNDCPYLWSAAVRRCPLLSAAVRSAAVRCCLLLSVVYVHKSLVFAPGDRTGRYTRL